MDNFSHKASQEWKLSTRRDGSTSERVVEVSVPGPGENWLLFYATISAIFSPLNLVPFSPEEEADGWEMRIATPLNFALRVAFKVCSRHVGVECVVDTGS